MPDNSAAIVIDIGTTNCKVTRFFLPGRNDVARINSVTAK